MRKLAVVFALAGLLSGVDFQGYLKFFAHPRLVSPFNFDRYGSRFQLTMKEKRQNIEFFASFDFDLDQKNSVGSGDRASILKIYPVEAYVTFHFSAIDLKLGKQFVFWGRTDWINPTDNITPWDYTNITAEIEDYRLAVNAVKADWFFGTSSLEFVFVPYFTPNRTGMEIPGAEEILPKQKPENWQEGIRFSSSIAGVNFSTSYWRGFDLFPTVVPSMTGLQIEYGKQQVFGADFDYAVGRFVFKGEGAYYLTEDRDGTDPFLKNPYLKYVLGADWNVADNLTLNLQFVQKRILKWHEGLMGPTERKTTNSASVRLSYKKEGFYNIQFIGVYNFEDGDYFLLPIFTYEISDGVNLYVGATIFNGPENSVFGRSKDFSKAFIEIKYSF